MTVGFVEWIGFSLLIVIAVKGDLIKQSISLVTIQKITQIETNTGGETYHAKSNSSLHSDVAGFYFYSSNQQTKLLQSLASTIRSPKANPLEPDLIIVQSQGMKRWISLELASVLGICSNTQFLFPNQFIETLFETVNPNNANLQYVDRDDLVWRILNVFPSVMALASFETVNAYLMDSDHLDELKAYQLAKRIAYVFDQYTMYRPNQVLAWEKGEETHWQADLWRMLRDTYQLTHLPQQRIRFFDSIGSYSEKGGRLPSCINVFGITSLPLVHIDILKALSDYTDIHLYFLNPSREFWADIASEKESARRLSRLNLEQNDPEEFYFEVGNSLLASLGKTGQAFFHSLVAMDSIDVTDENSFVSPGRNSLLTSIQSDIFELTELTSDSDAKNTVLNDDPSVQLHSCHSRTREVETLWDQLLGMFERDKSLKPSDVLVMAPDIDPYVPIIESVFAPDNDNRISFPYAIADRHFWRESKILSSFLKLLELPDERFGFSIVFELLEQEPIASCFGLTEASIETTRRWFDAVNVRWGIDGDHKASFGSPNISENTWAFGIDRLMLGVAMPDDEMTPYEEILPKDLVEGSDTEILGNFLEFFDHLKRLVEPPSTAEISESGLSRVGRMNSSRSLREWSVYFLLLIDQFFIEDERWESDVQALREILGQLDDQAKATEFNELVSFEVIKSHLKDAIEKISVGRGFLGSGVTFCSMLPMRSIPARVVALLGLNERDFPRASQPVSFDLIASHPRLGDRSQKEDDRYLMLEALVSAQEILYLSYIGQSVLDNSVIPPSSLIDELLFYVDRNFQTETGTAVSEQIVRTHHLQAFHPDYFYQSHPEGSFSKENGEAAKVCLEKKSKQSLPFIQSLSPPEDEWKTVPLDQLIEFFSHPAQFLLRNRLGLNLGSLPDVLDESEPLSIGNLDKYNLAERVLEEILAGKPLEPLEKRVFLEGILPPGPLGKDRLKSLEKEAGQFASHTAEFLTGRRETVPVDLVVDQFRIVGQIDSIWSGSLIHYRPASIKLKDRMTVWIAHLVLQTMTRLNLNGSSVLIGAGKPGGDPVVITLKPVPNPEQIITELLAYYWKGLRAPLPLFPKTSLAYMDTLRGKKPENALSVARNSWGNEKGFPEKNDPYLAKCFGSKADPLAGEFQETTRAILEPMFENEV